jgi:hypothetical protein
LEAIVDDVDGTTQEQQPELSSLLRGHRPEHPALARAHDRLASAENQVITSYDRMHHRHSRS